MSRIRLSQIARFRNGVADGEHQPIGAGVQNKADLVGERRAARRAIGGELGLVQLDEIFRLPARAIEAFVEPFGRAVVEIGDDEADVEPEPRGFDAGDGASFRVPGTGPVAGLGLAAHDILVDERAFRANGVGRLLDLARQRL